MDNYYIRETYYESGNLKQERQYWDNGKLKRVANYKDDKSYRLHGKLYTYYENGSLEWHEDYKDGKLHGKVYKWYPNGSRDTETSYRDGKQHGKRIQWYSSGEKEKKVSAILKTINYYTAQQVLHVGYEWQTYKGTNLPKRQSQIIYFSNFLTPPTNLFLYVYIFGYDNSVFIFRSFSFAQ